MCADAHNRRWTYSRFIASIPGTLANEPDWIHDPDLEIAFAPRTCTLRAWRPWQISMDGASRVLVRVGTHAHEFADIEGAVRIHSENVMSTDDIRQLLTEMGSLSARHQIDDADSLFDAGVIDSIGLMDLVMRIEAKFNIKVEADDLTPEHFDSIAEIARFVGERIAST